MKKALLIGLMLAISSLAHAMPGMDGNAPGKTSDLMSNASEKYTKMDSDADKNVSSEEFKTAYPQMTEAVFGIIDKDKNNGISLEEWMSFQSTHMQGMKEEEARKASEHKAGSGARLITPPKQ